MGRLAVSLSTPKYNLDSLLQTTLDHFTTPIRQAAPNTRQGA
jgi:hypothetical protein